MNAKKTIVLGLDGAHFELIEPWIQQGELPNVKRAIKNGVTADMQSVLPPVTSPNWKAYATGKNPGKLGIFWWENVDMGAEQVFYPDERKSTHPDFWEIIGDHSSAGVVNVPTTYPPREVNPFIVAGAPDAGRSGYTQPPELEDELREELDYKVAKETPIRTHPDEAADEILDLIDLRFRTGKYLLNTYDPEFLQVTTFYLNSLHHFFWDDHRTLKSWKVIDKHLGDFLDKEYNVVLMSDHGSTEIDTIFHINTWLKQEGYLSLDMGVSSTLGSLGITMDRLIRLVSRFGIRDFTQRIAPESLLKYIPSEEGEVQRGRKAANLDWSETTVLASSQGPIYVDKSDEKYEEIRSELIEKLSNLTGPHGKAITEDVHLGEDVYEGQYVNEAPDIIIDQTNGIHIQGGLGRDKVFTEPENDGWKGENKRDALFIATGPDFTTGTVEDLSILDLAPTFLYLHGSKIPTDLDGRVRTEVFEMGTDTADSEVTYFKDAYEYDSNTEPSEENSDVRDRLEDLGYLE